VAQEVIHILEAVEIDEDNRDLCFRPLSGLNKLAKPVLKQDPVWWHSHNFCAGKTRSRKATTSAIGSTHLSMNARHAQPLLAEPFTYSVVNCNFIRGLMGRA
jgi:hypothetical protein